MNDIVLERFEDEHIRRKARVPIICVYNSPSDYPAQYVARLWDLQTPTAYVVTAGTLDEIRRLIPQNLIRFSRSQQDDPCIEEAWI